MRIPGRSLPLVRESHWYYATCGHHAGYAMGMHVSSHCGGQGYNHHRLTPREAVARGASSTSHPVSLALQSIVMDLKPRHAPSAPVPRRSRMTPSFSVTCRRQRAFRQKLASIDSLSNTIVTCSSTTAQLSTLWPP
ncbi:hypothetical protein L210DRAFT_3549153 [Boletus edulis BED1]|uniref:Uncharacterized protein n=1 Tax=Boletus edulis BED1 TaxID=1328754 RepID=A0AAD4BPY4_BOLED|nr:hypothetical protein L210DRAFT_3549153 [Boletus edulis BED1]